MDARSNRAGLPAEGQEQTSAATKARGREERQGMTAERLRALRRQIDALEFILGRLYRELDKATSKPARRRKRRAAKIAKEKLEEGYE